VAAAPRLVPAPAPTEGVEVLPLAAIESVRIELPLRVDPSGYLLQGEVRPADALQSVISFFVVLGVVLINLVTLLAARRRVAR
jgi:hypothetical protein